jgi:hypothetical protein
VDPDEEWPFRSYLARYAADSGLTHDQIAERVTALGHKISNRRIGQMISGDATGTKWQVVEALSLVLGFDFNEGMRLAGLTMPANRHRKTDPITVWTLDEMLDAIRGRFTEQQQTRAAEGLPPLGRDQHLQRGQTVVRLTKLAKQVREDDPAGAALIQALADRMKDQIEATAAGAVDGSQPQHTH